MEHAILVIYGAFMMIYHILDQMKILTHLIGLINIKYGARNNDREKLKFYKFVNRKRHIPEEQVDQRSNKRKEMSLR